MPTPLPDQVRMKITEYLSGAITLDELDRWVTAATWFAAKEPELDALVGELMLLVAEYQRGHWTEREVREQLETTASAFSSHATGPL